MGNIAKHNLITASVSASLTSPSVDVTGFCSMTFFVTRSSHSAGSSAFSVEVSMDGVNFVPYKRLIDNVANTNVQETTRIQTKTLSANGADFFTIEDDTDVFTHVRLTAVRTTDGVSDAKLIVRY